MILNNKGNINNHALNYMIKYEYEISIYEDLLDDEIENEDDYEYNNELEHEHFMHWIGL